MKSDEKERFPLECGVCLMLLARLYVVEKEIGEGGLYVVDTKDLRAKKLSSSHERIHRVLEILRRSSIPKSELGKAFDYSLVH